MKELGTWRQRARGKTGKKGGKEKDGDKKERKQKDKGLNFYSFARAKCYLRSTTCLKNYFQFLVFCLWSDLEVPKYYEKSCFNVNFGHGQN